MFLKIEAKTKEIKKFSWPAKKSFLTKAFEIFCKTVFKFYCPVSYSGLENLPAGPFILCSNHSSHLDSVLLMVCGKLSFSETGLIAAKDYFFDQSHRSFLHGMLNLVPIERGSGAKALDNSIEACESFLSDNGRALIIFPEGTRSTTGEIARFKEGAFIMANRLNIPLVPAYIHNASKALRKGSNFIWPTKIHVAFGKPIFMEDFVFSDAGKDMLLAYKEAAAKTKESVEKLKEQVINVC